MKSYRDKINKSVTGKDLNSVFESILKLETFILKEAELFLSIGEGKGRIHTMDLYISAIINRSIFLMRGFTSLAKENNYISAIPLIRIQIDNCLRLYASTIVEDTSRFFIEYLEGKHIGNMVDAKGNKMTDNYLVCELDKNLFSGIKILYKNTSGYIHLSNEHSFLQSDISSKTKDTLQTRIGYYDFYSIIEKVDFSFNMYKASEFLLTMVKSWKYNKILLLNRD